MKKILIILFILSILLIAGCGEKVILQDIYKVPTVNVEATVISLYLDDLYLDCQKPEVCPRDRVTIKIDKIDRTNDPNNIVKLNIGDEIEVPLLYSARLAKVRKDIPPICEPGEILKSESCMIEGCEGSECTISSPRYIKKPAEQEGIYLIYHLPQRGEDIVEKILPGLKENSRLKLTFSNPITLTQIGVYELII